MQSQGIAVAARDLRARGLNVAFRDSQRSRLILKMPGESKRYENRAGYRGMSSNANNIAVLNTKRQIVVIKIALRRCWIRFDRGHDDMTAGLIVERHSRSSEMPDLRPDRRGQPFLELLCPGEVLVRSLQCIGLPPRGCGTLAGVSQ